MKVLVAIPFFNSEKFLEFSIKSILDQSFKEFDLWLINDKSTDRSLEIAKSFNDKRIKIFNNEKNIGLTRTLNMIIRKSDHNILIRMDSDDISHKDRIAEQLKVFKKDPQIGVCFSSRKILFSNKTYNDFFPSENLKFKFLQKNWIAHPTVALNLDILKTHKIFYDPKIKYAQDYDLWCKMIINNIKFYHIKKPLLFYREHSNQIASRKRVHQKIFTLIVKLKFILNIIFR